jgi:hypothetical protein
VFWFFKALQQFKLLILKETSEPNRQVTNNFSNYKLQRKRIVGGGTTIAGNVAALPNIMIHGNIR